MLFCPDTGKKHINNRCSCDLPDAIFCPNTGERHAGNPTAPMTQTHPATYRDFAPPPASAAYSGEGYAARGGGDGLLQSVRRLLSSVLLVM